MSKRLLIVEESLRDLTAHWFEYIKTISKGAISEHWQVEVAAHQNVTPEIKTELNIFPLFRHAYYLDSQKKQLPGWRYYGFLIHSWRCLKVLFPFLKQQNRYDEVFVPTVLVHHLLAWWAIAKFHPRAPKHITLFFVTNPSIWDKEKGKPILPKSSRLQGWLLKLFTKLIQQHKVTFAVETQGAKSEFEALTGMPFRLLPHPVPKFNFKVTPRTPLNFACYGFARYEKGADLFQDAIAKLLTQQPDLNGRFSIQWVTPFSLPNGDLCQPDFTFTEYPQVEIIDRPLLSEDYQTLLRNTACMILPYRNSSYHARVSRVAIEAMCLGIPVIYTKGGWLEEVIIKYGAGIGIEDENTVELSSAIILMLDNFETYQHQAIAKQEIAQQYFSAQNFCQLLLPRSKSVEKPIQLHQYSSSSI